MVMVDHPQSVTDGLSLLLKFLPDWIRSFRDSASLNFGFLTLSYLLTPPCRGFGAFSLNDVTYRPISKRPSLSGNTSFEP